MNMRDCPKWDSCNAPLCPLDKGISQRVYLRGEAICFYMHEYVKTDSYGRFKACHRGYIYQAISDVLKEVLSTHGYIKNRLERASNTPSRMTVTSNKKEMVVTE